MVFTVSDGSELLGNIQTAVAKCRANCACRHFLGLPRDQQPRKLRRLSLDVGAHEVIHQRVGRVEPAEAGNERVEVPVGGRPALPLAVAERQGGVVVERDEQRGPRLRACDEGAEVADEAGLVVVVVEAADEALGQGLDGAHHLGRPHALGLVDALQDVVGGEDVLPADGRPQ
eukprot:763500-Hanusia_phi.AAC.3